MQRFSHLYQSEEKLSHFMKSRDTSNAHSLLVKIITASGNQDEACQIARQVKNCFPNAVIAGASSSDVILLNGEQYTEATAVIFEYYNTCTIKSEIFSLADSTPEQLSSLVYNTYNGELAGSTSPINILFTAYKGVYRFIRSFNMLSPIIRLAGGCVGNHLNPDNGEGFIFNETGVFSNSVFTFAIVGAECHHYMYLSSSQDTITPSYTITKASDGIIDEIEGVPALRWMYDFLSFSKSENDYENWQDVATKDYLVHFPLMLESDGSGRFTKIDSSSGKLALYTTELFDNTPFRIGYVNPAKVIKDTYRICSEILDTPSEGMFCYVCYFRKLFLENCAKWEIAPFSKHNICGMFLMGEIAYANDINSLYNGANVFTSIAEGEQYILPDYVALENAGSVRGDETFLKKAHDMQRENMMSNVLLSTLKQKETIATDNLHYDNNFNIPNIYRFEKDNLNKKYTKICFVESQTADATIAFAGQEKYYDSVRDFIQMFNEALSNVTSEVSFNIYALNYKTLVFASDTDLNEQDFIEFTRNLYQHFGYATSKRTKITAVNRVVIMINQDNPIEQGISFLQSLKDSQETFIVFDSSYYDFQNNNPIDDLKGIELLKRAIDKDLIVPYYQGIYDNNNGRIDKYEALIRIVDLDGTVYSPVSFLSTSKKYRFYNCISQRMIEKVLIDFKNRKESVSINISKYDIVSSHFRSWLISTIINFPEPERIVVEFLETEDFTETDVLFGFINKLKGLGTQIAIDDFGSGYSTFTTIVALKPNYIKIDGSIIKDLLKNEDHQVILDSICYLANRIGADTVAEFVETEELHNFLTNKGITYSQGYHLAKPTLLNNLETTTV